jgi:hypothetical protein
MSEQRARVQEWRITTRVGPYVVRYWIEADEDHGGIRSMAEAFDAVREAQDLHPWSPAGFAGGLDFVGFAHAILEVIPEANSVEVCLHIDGNGIAIHRDWP